MDGDFTVGSGSQDISNPTGPESKGTQVAVKGGHTPVFTVAWGSNSWTSEFSGLRVSFCNNSAAYSNYTGHNVSPWRTYTGVFFFLLNPGKNTP